LARPESVARSRQEEVAGVWLEAVARFRQESVILAWLKVVARVREKVLEGTRYRRSLVCLEFVVRKHAIVEHTVERPGQTEKVHGHSMGLEVHATLRTNPRLQAVPPFAERICFIDALITGLAQLEVVHAAVDPAVNPDAAFLPIIPSEEHVFGPP
jgi:hypothetical protein